MNHFRFSKLLVVVWLFTLVACQTQAAPSAIPSTGAPTAVPLTAVPTAGATPVATVVTVDSIPSGSPLTLVWQTGSAPEAIMQDPIHLAMDPQGNIYVGSATPTGLILVLDPNGKFVTAWAKNGLDDREFGFLLGIVIDSQGTANPPDFNRMRAKNLDTTGQLLTHGA